MIIQKKPFSFCIALSSACSLSKEAPIQKHHKDIDFYLIHQNSRSKTTETTEVKLCKLSRKIEDPLSLSEFL